MQLERSNSSVLGGLTAIPLLRLFNRIRFAFGLVLVSIGYSDSARYFFSSDKLDAPILWLGIFYITAAAVLYRLITSGKQSVFVGAYISNLVDIALISVLLGLAGLDSGFQSLLIIPSLSGALLLRQPHTYAMAAVSSLLLLSLYVLESLNSNLSNERFVSAGALGITLFAIALSVQFVSRQLSDRAEQIRAAGVDLANLTAVNALVIQNLEHGVIVCDRSDNVKMANQLAFGLLGLSANHRFSTLKLLNEELADRLALWRLFPNEAAGPILVNGKPITPSFRYLDESNSGYLIYLTDAELASKEAQKQKLASLGQLTASIAHEIRNPLTAITSAGQLLEEGGNLSESDLRLAQIIHDHCLRVNTIIENVLQLSSRQHGTVSSVQLDEWLHKFLDDYSNMTGIDNALVQREIESIDRSVSINSGHLDQIMRNLLDNAMKYGLGDKHRVRLRCAMSPTEQRIWVDVIDNGPGIPLELRSRVFEPFYTAGSGSGLGLYIANELASVNGARLSIEAQTSSQQGAHFRLSIAPDD